MGTKFTKSTDKEHKVKLESSILHALWSANVAYAGSEVGVEVKTMFVGEGGKINITGKSEKGKNLGKIKDKIYGNGYSGKLKIPDKIKPGDVAYFTVKLPQLGLKAESNRIRLVPKIEVSNMKWDKDEARRGDTLKLTADVEGVRDESEVKVLIYERGRDGNRDRIAEIPTEVKNKKVEVLWEYEYYEKTGEIPTEEQLQAYDKKKHYSHPEYYFTITIGETEYGKDQESKLLKFRDWVEVSLIDENGNKAADEKYVLYLADGSKKEGKLDDNGYAKAESIPPGVVYFEFPDAESIADAGKEQELGVLKPKDWFEISLVDEDGKPVPNERYILYLSDGSKREGILDNEGFVSEQGIPPGEVYVEFPDADYITTKGEEND